MIDRIANAVDQMILALGNEITLESEAAIKEARSAYENLSFRYKALQSWGIPAITIVNAGIVFAVLWFVPPLRTKVFKTKKKEEEVIDN